MSIIYGGNIVDKDKLFRFDKENDIYHWSIDNFGNINNIITATKDNKLVGFLIYNNSHAVEILRICVAKIYRKMNVATNLIKKLPPKDTFLEVREDNLQAINLYTKLGFLVVGKRKNYYQGKINAIVMCKKY